MKVRTIVMMTAAGSVLCTLAALYLAASAFLHIIPSEVGPVVVATKAMRFYVLSSPDGMAVTSLTQGQECEEGGGCRLMSMRQFHSIAFKYVEMLEQRPSL